MFLDQDEIDRLQQELSVVTAKVNLAQSAKDKVKIMFYDTTGSPLHSKLDNLDKQVHVAVWRAVRDIRRIQLRKHK